MPRNESLRALHVPIGNVSDDLRHLMRRKIDPDDGSCLRDMDMRRRVIERVDPYLESLFTNYRRHIIPNALGFIDSLGDVAGNPDAIAVRQDQLQGPSDVLRHDPDRHQLRPLRSRAMWPPTRRPFLVRQPLTPVIQRPGGDAVLLRERTRAPAVLAPSVDMLDHVPMDDRDTKGDLYEYMLGKIARAGQNGQFRTPRHIIRLMVEMMEPTATDVICDPAWGTCGFLVAAGEHLRERHPGITDPPPLAFLLQQLMLRPTMEGR